jgi:hypothetical protein
MRRRRADAVAMGRSAEHFAAKALNYWRKRHPFDCGNPRCGICHSGPKGRPQPKERW